MSTSRPGALALPLFLLAPLALPAAAQTFTWDGESNDGFWFTDLNWLDDVVPAAGGDVVVGAPAPTNLNGTATVGELTINADGELTLLNSFDLLLGGDVLNDGTITLAGTAAVTEFRVNDSLSLTGAGELVIGPDGLSTGVNFIGDDGFGGNTLTNGADHTIRALGIGVLGRNTTDLVNAGFIVSDAGGALTINAAASLVNTGTIATAGGGTISLTGFELDNTGGTIDATNGTVTLAGNVTLTGDSTVLGTLETTGFNTFDDLTTAGSIRLTNSADVAVNGLLTNNGTITLDGTAAVTELRVNSDTTLAGTGEVVIGPGGLSTGVNVIGDDGFGGNTLTNGADHTIRALGVGQLGRNTTNIVNDGSVVSDGGDLTINPNDTFINNGDLNATAGGTLRIGSGVFENSGSIDAADGTIVLAGGVTLRGTGSVAGTLEAVGVNTLETLGTDADLLVTNASDLLVNGTITNNGTITLDGTAAVTELRVNSDTTLAGTGEVVIGPGGLSTGVNVIGDDGFGGNTLTNGPDHTIRVLGLGALGRGTTDVVNNGSVVVDGGDLLIDPSGTFTNAGLLTAVDGGDLRIAGGTFANSGVIDTADGTLTLNGGVTLQGGGSFLGTVETIGTNTLADLSADADLLVTNASDLLVNGTITNNGTITLDGTAAVTELRVNSDTTLAGTGEVVIGPGGLSTGVNVIGDDGSGGNTLTNGADHTIRALGIGVLGRNTTNIVNDGLVVSEGGALTIDPAGTFTNNGTLQASEGGTVSLATGSYDNAGTFDARTGGVISATAGADVVQLQALAFGDNIEGGTYRAFDGTLNVAQDDFDARFNSGTLNFFGAAAETNLFDEAASTPGNIVSNAFSFNDGTVIVQGGANLSTEAINGTFNNAGTVVILGTSTFAVTEGVGNGTFINGSPTTLTGTGTLAADLVNDFFGVTSPGSNDDPGTLTVDGDAVFGTNGSLLIDIAGTGDNDLLVVNGALDLAGILEVDLLASFAPTDGEQFLIATAAVGQIIGSFDTINDNSALYDFTQTSEGGNVFLQANVIPEPGTAALALTGLALLTRRRRTA